MTSNFVLCTHSDILLIPVETAVLIFLSPLLFFFLYALYDCLLEQIHCLFFINLMGVLMNMTMGCLGKGSS